MKLHFSKYHGTGNDFIMIDEGKNDMLNLSSDSISRLCDRHFGIGADGLIILRRSDEYDFRMEYYNSDGRISTMCGNGGRCITAFARKSGWISDACTFEAADGLHRATVLSDGRIRLQLRDVDRVNELENGCFLDTGSPHLVLFVNDTDNLDVFTEGKRHRYDKAYPGGTNVNFVQLTGEGIMVRTYERGVENETLSCGTGVTASAIASFLHSKSIQNPVSVKTPGGPLEVAFHYDPATKIFSEVYLTGMAEEVFGGSVKA